MAAPATADLSDAALARAIMAGGAGAAEAELCRRFGPRVRLYGLRHLGKADRAEDLVQRVLEVTLTKLRARALREPERVASFVLGVARMEAHATRRRGRLETLAEDPTDAPSPGTAPVLPTRNSEPEPLGRERLIGCLHALSERERSVLLLAYFQDQSAPEIGSALGLSPGNVRIIRLRAMQRLRACMGLGHPEREEEP